MWMSMYVIACSSAYVCLHLWVHTYSCVSGCLLLCVNICACVWSHVHVCEATHFDFWFETGFLFCPRAYNIDEAGWLGSWSHRSARLFSQVLDLGMCVTMHAFLKMWVLGTTSSPHAYEASALLTELFPFFVLCFRLLLLLFSDKAMHLVGGSKTCYVAEYGLELLILQPQPPCLVSWCWGSEPRALCMLATCPANSFPTTPTPALI